jgi:hypothetical protein
MREDGDGADRGGVGYDPGGMDPKSEKSSASRRRGRTVGPRKHTVGPRKRTVGLLITAVLMSGSPWGRAGQAPEGGGGVGTGAGLLLPLELSPETPPGDVLVMTAGEVSTWEDADGVAVIQLGRLGGERVRLSIDATKLEAQSAVVWISRQPGTVLDNQLVRIALLGDATLEQDGVRRGGGTLYVTAVVRGTIRVSAPSRVTRDDSAGETFKVAQNLRMVAEAPSERVGSALVARPAGEPPPKRELESVDVRRAPIRFTAGFSPTIETADGRMAVLLSGGATILQRRPNGDFLELRAERAVLLTNVRSMTELDDAQRAERPEDVISAAYLEGDVRVNFTPAQAGGLGEQRLEAERVYYEFATDRAILTDAVLHSVEPQRQIPVVFRAKTVQQIAQGEYQTEKVELSTSSFAVPTYSVRASRMYVRQSQPRFENDPARTVFRADNLTLNVLGMPVGYLPVAGGDANNFPLRSVAVENSDRFGFGVRTQWGLYESFGRPHPRDLDVSYRLDYLDNRGPAAGVDADYRGGLVTETTSEPWNFSGRVRSYLIQDQGDDRFAGDRRNVDTDRETRGRVLFEHQHFLPEDWQVQLRAGYSSDATFLEQYFDSEFNTQLPYELAFYAKRQRDSEQLSVLATTSINDFPTTSELVQEQTFVQRYPEIAYRRIGDSFLDDRLTFFSDNVGSVLSFRNSGTSLLDQGYPAGLSPGIGSFAQTGTDEDTVLRGDFRQEVQAPSQLGQFKVVPFVVGRYTPYTESATSGAQNRLYAAVGTRISTAFWRTDDSIVSELFDIRRMRHVIEPVVNLYTSATTVDRSEIFIYDEEIDGINDISAAVFRLEQRWQTKRGGVGRWRSVDVFTFNIEAAFFTNQPSDELLNPADFRGLYFETLPETSIARQAINADASWRISDTTILLADQQYNVEENNLATLAAGLAIERDPRLTYSLEQRYVEPLDSNITSFAVAYQVSAKYLLQLSQSYDLSDSNNVGSAFTVNRRFDRVIAAVTIYSDNVNDETGVRFLLIPEGLGGGQRAQTAFTATNPPIRR